MAEILAASAVLPDIVVAVPATLPPWAGGVGGGGGAGLQFTQITPSASWSFTHTIGRLPNVQIYIAGKAVLADVEATSTTVLVTFATAQSGVAVLT
jgi:hypothetical protein